MAKVAPRTLSGFMELLPADQMKMEKMIIIIMFMTMHLILLGQMVE